MRRKRKMAAGSIEVRGDIQNYDYIARVQSTNQNATVGNNKKVNVSSRLFLVILTYYRTDIFDALSKSLSCGYW